MDRRAFVWIANAEVYTVIQTIERLDCLFWGSGQLRLSTCLKNFSCVLSVSTEVHLTKACAIQGTSVGCASHQVDFRFNHTARASNKFADILQKRFKLCKVTTT